MQESIALTNTVIAKIRPYINNGSIPTQAIARSTLHALKHFDEPAAVSYQAFHSDIL